MGRQKTHHPLRQEAATAAAPYINCRASGFVQSPSFDGNGVSQWQQTELRLFSYDARTQGLFEDVSVPTCFKLDGYGIISLLPYAFFCQAVHMGGICTP